MSGQPKASTDGALALTAPKAQRLDVLVVLGTDYHPFSRLVQWVDAWVGAQEPGYRSVVQHGYTPPPILGEGRKLLAHDELQSLIADADIVVMHGGPASIMEARGLGKVPIVVPRDPRHGEHVDGHQLRFARRVAELNLIWLCEEEDTFTSTLRAVRDNPSMLRARPAEPGELGGEREGAAEVARIVDELIARRAAERTAHRMPRPRRSGR